MVTLSFEFSHLVTLNIPRESVSYISRAGKKTKDPLPDLVKARHYLTLKIEQLTKEPALSTKSWLDPNSYNLGREVTNEYDIPDFTD